MKIYKLEKTMYKHGAYEDEFGDKVDGYSEYFLKEEDAISKFNEIFARKKEFHENLDTYKIIKSKSQGHDYAELWNKNFITLIYIFEVDVK